MMPAPMTVTLPGGLLVNVMAIDPECRSGRDRARRAGAEGRQQPRHHLLQHADVGEIGHEAIAQLAHIDAIGDRAAMYARNDSGFLALGGDVFDL